MKALERYIINNWFWLSVGCILTNKAVEMAYFERGCRAIGGEWLVLPAILLAVKVVRAIIWSIAEMMQLEEEDDTRTYRNHRK